MKLENTLVAAKVIIYHAEPEEYYTFVTVEAYNAVKEWMDFRAQHGEKIDGSSWIVRDLWNLQTDSAVVPRKLQSGGVKRLIERALWAQGIRKTKVKNKNQAGKHRHEFQAEAGFRQVLQDRLRESDEDPLRRDADGARYRT